MQEPNFHLQWGFSSQSEFAAVPFWGSWDVSWFCLRNPAVERHGTPRQSFWRGSGWSRIKSLHVGLYQVWMDQGYNIVDISCWTWGWLPIKPPRTAVFLRIDWHPCGSYHMDTSSCYHFGLGVSSLMQLYLLPSLLPSTHPSVHKTHMNYLSVLFMACCKAMRN